MLQALRAWSRYLVPLTLLSVIAQLPVAIVALRTHAPADLAGAAATLTRGWGLLGLAVIGQLVLVGGAAAVTGARPSQLRAFTAGLVRLVHAIVPCLAALAAVVIGCLALVVPGVVLLALLSLTGASPERGVRARLSDSIAVARARLPAVALAVAGLLLLDAAIVVLAPRVVVGRLPAHPTPAQLLAVRDAVRVVALALIAVSPVPATVLAAIRTRAGRPAP